MISSLFNICKSKHILTEAGSDYVLVKDWVPPSTITA